MRMARAGAQSGVKLDALLGEEHDHRGAEQETPHLLALFERDLARGVVPFADLAGARRVDLALPHGGHAADDGGAHQHQHEGADLVVLEHAHHPLVAGEQAGHAPGGGGVDREQGAGHVDHAAQAAVAGHVDAVVVPRAEVEGGELAVLELDGQVPVAAHQGMGGVVVALGLEDAVPVDVPELADGAIHRADEVGSGQGPGAGLEGAGEEIVETGVARDVRIGRFGHVDPVAPHEPADHRGSEPPGLRTGQRAGQHGDGLLGDQVLGKNGKAIGHGGFLGSEGPDYSGWGQDARVLTGSMCRGDV
jgi:hypothetical protein